MDLKKYIGDNIRKFRLDQGMSQEDLAAKLDTTKQSISRYEKGDRQANQDILFSLAEIFNKRVDDFFPPIENEYPALDKLPDYTDEDFSIEEMLFLRKLTEKALSFHGEERDKFLESIRFTVEFYDKLKKGE